MAAGRKEGKAGHGGIMKGKEATAGKKQLRIERIPLSLVELRRSRGKALFSKATFTRNESSLRPSRRSHNSRNDPESATTVGFVFVITSRRRWLRSLRSFVSDLAGKQNFFWRELRRLLFEAPLGEFKVADAN